MIKLVMPLSRRPGMSVEAFREYYESIHRKIGEKYLAGYATKYTRRYTQPMPTRPGQITTPDVDVFLEIWYPDQETFEACSAHLAQPEIRAEILADEARLFDTRRMHAYLVEEHTSDL